MWVIDLSLKELSFGHCHYCTIPETLKEDVAASWEQVDQNVSLFACAVVCGCSYATGLYKRFKFTQLAAQFLPFGLDCRSF